MKISSSLLLSASLFCFLGCTEDKKTSTETTNSESIAIPPPAATSTQATDLNAANPQASTEITSTPATATTTAAGMNPPHGQPGHDCAIAVGAPLNSKGSSTSAPQPNSTPKATIEAPKLSVPAVSNTAPGLNPPHGQPGHDCAIAVGAPLKK